MCEVKMEKFTKEKVELLIDLVRCNTVLYDASDKQYKDSICKHKVWEYISETLDIPVTDIKKRWKHLRDHYAKKKKTAKCHNNWEYMSQLSFLSQPPSQRSTLPKQEPNDDTISLETDDTEMIADTLHNHETNATLADVKNDPLSSPSINEDPSRIRKRKASNNTLITLLEKGEDERAALYAKLSGQETTTPIKKFFESMADIVSQFPPHLAAEARLKVCQVVTELEIKMHNEHTGSTTVTTPQKKKSINLRRRKKKSGV